MPNSEAQAYLLDVCKDPSLSIKGQMTMFRDIMKKLKDMKPELHHDLNCRIETGSKPKERVISSQELKKLKKDQALLNKKVNDYVKTLASGTKNMTESLIMKKAGMFEQKLS